MTPERIARDLLAAARDIAAVNEMAPWAPASIAIEIMNTGRPVNDLSVGELRKLVNQCTGRE